MFLAAHRALLWLLLLGFAMPVLATHQVGGQIEMRAIGDTPGHFRIIVTNYLEDNNRAAQTTGGDIGIFRRRDNQRMMVFSVRETDQRQKVVFTNEACATSQNQRMIVATFGADIQLNPLDYNDAAGYYMSFQTQNRNAGINNITNPLQTGFTFYLEFPALVKDGQYYNNSSPRFNSINGEYLCINEPFTFPFGGVDPDGDELRYSMITPLNKNGGNSRTSEVSSGPYPDIQWLPGFAPNSSIPGNPTLQVDSRSGQLSVTPSQLGLFVFAVKVEEYRNGIKIGEVRRDFQFLVIDCPPVTAPNPPVWATGQLPATDFTICKGKSLELQTSLNPDWNYQWRRDGINLADATGTKLTVNEPGTYSVFVSLKTQCGKASGSQNVRVNVIDLSSSINPAGQLCATDGSVTLSVPGGVNMKYDWFKDEKPVTVPATDNTLTITQPGQYRVTLTQTQFGCTYTTPTVSLTRAPVVQADIRSAQTRICPGASLPLEGLGGVSFAWQRDGQPVATVSDPIFSVQTAGTYVVEVTAENGCKAVSKPFAVEQIPPVTVTMEAIPSVCGTEGPVYSLTGTPAGGTFAGPGVSGNQYDSKAAGIGNHVLTYSINFAPECPAAVAQQTAVVAPIPTVLFPEEIITSPGTSLTISPQLTGDPVRFAWSPPTYLADATEANARVENIGDDIVYTLNVENATGCKAEGTLVITVYERIWVPGAFTPNADGQNDVWELKNVEAFPDVEVTVFNRWGEVIYWSKDGYTHPFDGTMKGEAVPAGAYAYAIRYKPDSKLLRGTLMILR
ncbi:gliding motility-associated C-terminal domain-containing protein [Larkinella terrae]|uniref:T9SS type B sorting domain-containing protein n=1 Tax=Larkinella terrae TaxID=2025311 RepID=A0A7K0ELW0_9BACT|nr:gliding motility-associated C-terminal domain-containing protein [Larkinella terrae]MRS62784.1 T9SS type B sorting domain-containing protein [Larkinella terrae]